MQERGIADARYTNLTLRFFPLFWDLVFLWLLDGSAIPESIG
jgi:hypothetical protein